MADEEDVTGTEGEEGEKKSGKMMKILLMVLSGLLLIIITVAVTLYVTDFFDVKKEKESVELLDELEEGAINGDCEEGEEGEDGGDEKEGCDDGELKKQVKETPDIEVFEQSYQAFKEKFTVNILNSSKFVQFSLAVMTHYDEKVLKNMDKHEIAMRSAVISLMATQPLTSYQTLNGRKMLLEKIKVELNKVLVKYESFGGIEEVYFPELVVQ